MILGATGPTGIHLVRFLADRVEKLRVVSRSRCNHELCFPDPGLEQVVGDMLESESTLRAVEGCDLVFDCIGLPGDQMDRHPLVATNIAEALRQTRARCVVISGFWGYLPAVILPLNEEHPRRNGPIWSQHRRKADDILEQAGAAVLNLPDFFGPQVGSSVLQDALAPALQGKSLNWMGSRLVEREHVFVPDAMRMAVEVAGHESAYGRRWIVPGSGPISGKVIQDIVSEHLGRKMKLQAAGPFLLRLISFFNKNLRDFMPMVPHYIKPISYDGSRLRELLGEVRTTPYEQAIGETLDWLRSESRLTVS